MADEGRAATFLFLPPTFQESVVSDKDIRWAINHHAQTVTARRRKKTQVSRVSRPRLLRPNDAVDASRVPLEEVAAANDDAKSDKGAARYTHGSQQQLVPRQRTQSPQSYLDSSRLDPFSRKHNHITPQMQSIYMYYFNDIMPTVEPIAAEREEYHSWLVPLTLSEPALLYALVGCMAYDIEESSSNGFGPVKQRNMLSVRTQYKIEAIRALNRCLLSPETALLPSTLVAVHFLLWQEVSICPTSREPVLTFSAPRYSRMRTACTLMASNASWSFEAASMAYSGRLSRPSWCTYYTSSPYSHSRTV
jgi:hypothetical protein